jgi:hypothetical protein
MIAVTGDVNKRQVRARHAEVVRVRITMAAMAAMAERRTMTSAGHAPRRWHRFREDDWCAAATSRSVGVAAGTWHASFL